MARWPASGSFPSPDEADEGDEISTLADYRSELSERAFCADWMDGLECAAGLPVARERTVASAR